jgi:hypothetical protein
MTVFKRLERRFVVSLFLGPVFILLCVLCAAFKSNLLWGITAATFLVSVTIRVFFIRCPECRKSIDGCFTPGGSSLQWMTSRYDFDYTKPSCPFCGFDLMTE